MKELNMNKHSAVMLAVLVSLATVPAMMADYEQTVLIQNPAVYYRFNTTDTETDPNLGWMDIGGVSFYDALTRGAEGPNTGGFEEGNTSLLLNGGYGQFGPLNTTVSELTILAWLKSPATRTQHQPGIVMSRGTSATGIEFKTTTYTLGYHWGDTSGSHGYTGGPLAEASQWNLVAVSINADGATFYSGDSAGTMNTGVNSVTTSPVTLSDPFYIGQDVLGSGVRSLTANDGEASIDEVAIFTRALSADDINAIYMTGRGEVVAPTWAEIQGSADLIYAGEGAFLTAFGNGTFDSIEWYKDGVKQTGGERVLSGLQAGTYTVTVKNSAGSATSEGFVVLASSKPVITVAPVAATRFLHGKVVFSVMAEGSLPLSYQWKLDGTDIEGATESSYSLDDIQADQFGTYTVQISNSQGNTLSSGVELNRVTYSEGSYMEAILAYDPLAFYRLDDPIDDSSTEYDETTGYWVLGVAEDYVAGNNGRYLGLYSDCKTDGAIAGDSNKAVHFPANGLIDTPLQFNGDTNFTVMGWVRRSIAYGEYTVSAGYFGQNDLIEIGDASGDRVEAYLNSVGNGAIDSIYAAFPFEDNVWGLLTCTYNGAEMILYADGVQVGNFIGVAPMTGGVDYAFNIGGSVKTVMNDFFLGDVDDVAVFKTALTAEQVRDIYIKGAYGAGAPPTIETQPMSIEGYENAERTWTMTVVAGGTPPFTYQWYKDGTEISDATTSSYSGAFITEDQGNYTVKVSNASGSVTSLTAQMALHIPSEYSYEESIYKMGPFAYWRLGETSGTVAHDYAGGKNGVFTSDNIQGQPGAINGDTDKSTGFGGKNQIITEPLGITNSDTITFAAWIKPTAGLDSGNKSTLLFNRSGTTDSSATGIELADGQLAYHWADWFYSYRSGLRPVLNEWNFVVLSVSPTVASFYLGDKMGNLTSATSTGEHKPINLLAKFTLGGDSFFGERKFYGDIDEAVIFDRTLNADDVEYLYNLGYVGVGTKPSIFTQPESQELFDGDIVTLNVTVRGTPPLSYQWYKDGVAIEGATTTVLSFQAGIEDKGNYTLEAVNAWGNVISDIAIVDVSYPPYSIDLSEGLFSHLKFDATYLDASGNGNDVTPVGEPEFEAGVIGQAIHTLTDNTNDIYNFAYFPGVFDLGSDPLTVSFWTQLIGSPIDFPWLTNSRESYGQSGFTLAPSYELNGWSWSLVANDSTSAYIYGPNKSLPSEQWHHLVFVMRPGETMKVFLDGKLVSTQDISGVTVGELDTGDCMFIGQTATCAYGLDDAKNGEMLIDDMGIWKKALSDLDARSIYYVALNGFSFDETHSADALPTILTQPQSCNFYENPDNTYTLSVTVGGPYPHNVEWFHDGKETGLTGKTINVALAAENSGQWTAKVSNSYGSVVSDPANLEFRVPEPGTYEELVVSLKPYSYWRLGESEGETAVDYAGGRNGVYTAANTLGQPGALVDDLDTSVAFDGSNQILTPSLNVTTDTLTLMAWVYPTSTLRSCLLYDRLGTGLGKQTTGLGLIDGQLTYHWNDRSQSYSYRSGIYTILNEWNFVAMTVSPTEATFYLGNSAGFVSATNVGTHPATLFEAPFMLGGDSWYTDRKLIGLMDEPAVFIRTLSEEEILSIFRKGGGDIPTGIELGYMVADDGSVLLAWEDGMGAILETASATDGVWSECPGAELIDGIWQLTVQTDSPAAFYRLAIK